MKYIITMLILSFAIVTHADIILIDVSTTSPGIGSDLVSTGSGTTNGLTLTTVSVGGLDGTNAVLLATANRLGVDSDGVGSAAEFDAGTTPAGGESWTFSFDQAGTLNEFAFGRIDDAEQFTFTIGASTYVIDGLHADLDGADVWTPSTPIAFTAGQSMTVQNTSEDGQSWRIYSMTVDTAAIPEPASLGLVLLGVAVLRRKMMRRS